ncbi:MAG TPA: homoserine kinase [Terracidiphilus sp.]|jgi:homoserine kinase|nr:homoserine kinase [Terracidiphilus sp.]
MSAAVSTEKDALKLRLPATSANLGSGFDAVAVALDFFLEVDATPAAAFSIDATGRDAERCARIKDNLILGVYERLLAENGRAVTPLDLRMRNEIPLGMGCGSSAAGRLAAILLANHFGGLGWNDERILEEVAALEGHPDNASACLLGGFVAASCAGRAVHVARVEPPADWRVIMALPPAPLATSKARAILPEGYSRADAVANIQAVSLLGLAFAQGRGDLLRAAMADRIHQPYREQICPMLPGVLPLAGAHGILGACLSGAGPAMLVIVSGEANLDGASAAIRRAVSGLAEPELLVCRFETAGARVTLSDLHD